MKCYEGSEPYIFLSYAHKNTDMVMPIFEGLYREGFRIWYDAGTEPGTEWPEYIAEHLAGASCCICFLTDEFLNSDNCRQELNFALSKKIPILVIYMEDVKLTAGMEMRLGLTQAMFRNCYATKTEFEKALFEVKLLILCRKPQQNEDPQKVEPAVRYSDGLEFKKRNDGTYAVTGMGIWEDDELVIPLTAPDGGKVASIGISAFSGCTGITSVMLPNSLTSIGDCAFSWCSKLMSIMIPNSVTSIGDFAFSDCIGLTSITIPDSVTSIGNFAFESCSNLMSITISDNITSIGEWAFYDCCLLKSIKIPNRVTSIGWCAFSHCRSLTSVTLPNGVTSIGDRALSGCSGLTSITIPNSVKSIGWQAFSNCKNATIYCEHPSQPDTWAKDWNPDNCPVVWNYKPENN